MPVDDSALLHGRYYDPVKAREYYLRTRQLKGRKKGSAKPESSGGRPQAAQASKLRPSRRQDLQAEKARLEKRLKELKTALEQLVDAAKKRSGIKDDGKNAGTSSASSTASKKGGSKSSTSEKLTESEKRKKREDSREAYAKENKTSLAVEVKQLHAQIKDMRAKLDKALEDARKRSSKPTTETASKGR